MLLKTDILQVLNADSGVKKISATYTLPSTGMTFRLEDFSSKDVMDDNYYKKTKSLYLRRGLCAIYHDEESTPVFLLAGIPKFGYIDDVLTTPITDETLKYKYRVYTEKENGEAGHLAFIKLDDVWYVSVGSKNVHIILSIDRMEEDIEYYKSLSNSAARLRTAIANAELLYEYCRDILKKKAMCEYLFKHDMTVVFEAVYNNHIVEYESKGIYTFAITQPQFDDVNRQGLAMPPDKSIELLKGWGFQIPRSIFVAKRESQKKEYDTIYDIKEQSEGAVVYEIYETSDTHKLIVGKIYKHKNYMYIVHRMVRELIKRRASFDGWMARINKLHFVPPPEIAKELETLLGFYAWITVTYAEEMKKGGGVWADKIQEEFKTLLSTFKKLPMAEQRNYIQNAVSFLNGNVKNNNYKAVLLVGLQGSGKTTLRNALMASIGGDHVKYVNQDELSGNRKRFMGELKPKKKDEKKITIVDKCNHLIRLREDVYNEYSKILIVEFIHPAGRLASLCESRIQKRGVSHPTLPYSSNIKNILQRCSDSYEEITTNEKENKSYIALNPLDKVSVNTKKVLDILQSDGFIAPENVKRVSGFNLDKMIEDYEEKMKKEAITKAMSWRASANIEDIRRNVLPIAPDWLNDIVYKWDVVPEKCFSEEEYHVTLVYGRKLTPAEVEAYLNKIHIKARATAIAYDKDAVALRVKLLDGDNVLIENEHPHITLGISKSVKAVYSNTMLEDPTHKEIPCDFTLDLTIHPVSSK